MLSKGAATLAAMKLILIALMGSTFPDLIEERGDFDRWIVQGMNVPWENIRVVRVAEGEVLPPVETSVGVVVTGSPAMVSERLPWSERAAQWLGDAVALEVPVLGVCYGHQLLAHALGGEVGPNPKGREIGTIMVERSEDPDSGSSVRGPRSGDPLWDGVPAQFPQHTTHSESVLQLPPGARLLARTALDPNHAFAVGRRAWGVQFHPEFDAAIMRSYLAERAEDLAREGLDAEALRKDVRDCLWGAKLLRRFARIALDSAG